jgi:hypothetical protein
MQVLGKTVVFTEGGGFAYIADKCSATVSDRLMSQENR